MKREFLESLDLGEGVKLPKSAIDAIMAENGRDIEAKNNQITTLTTERDGLQTQLSAANTTIQSYKEMDIDGIKAKAGEWETKYNTDTQALKDQLAATEYGFAVKEAVAVSSFPLRAPKRPLWQTSPPKSCPCRRVSCWVWRTSQRPTRKPTRTLFSRRTMTKPPLPPAAVAAVALPRGQMPL